MDLIVCVEEEIGVGRSDVGVDRSEEEVVVKRGT
jgi:hypothetical protein